MKRLFSLFFVVVCLFGFAHHTWRFGIVGDSNSGTYTSWTGALQTHWEIEEAAITSGARCDQLATTLDTYLADHSPDFIAIQCGVNDLSQSQSVSSTVTEIEGMVTAIKAANIVPIVVTPFPAATGASGTLITNLGLLAAALVTSGATNDYVVADAWQAIMDYDAVSGQDKDDLYLDADTIHLDPAGDLLAGEAVSEVIDTLVNPGVYTNFD